MSNATATWKPSTGVTHSEVVLDKGVLLVDLDESAGGGRHPSPHDLLDAALASCTTLTLELYIKRKGWAVTDVRCEVTHHRDADGAYRLLRKVAVTGGLDDEQRAAVLRIAEACPVHKTLSGTIAIDTLVDSPAG